ncbi:hypothetical protein, partial [Escherichia coli]|uniref:hypothetical protein n=1 Tax=Escherichia coli TaxID=562 RepID=UPI0019812792
ACKSDDIIHDDKSPVASFTSASGLFTNVQNLKVAWTAQDNLSGIDKVICHDNVGAEVSCTSSMTVANEKEGANSVRVLVRDKAGNLSDELFYGWVFDKTAPTVVLNTKPADISGSTAASLAFSGNDSGSGITSYSCKLDAAPASACTSPRAFSG